MAKTSVKVGDEYPEIKRGVGAKGEYAFVTVGEKSDKISVFFNNPESVPEGTYGIRIKAITEVSVSNRQYNGNWYKNFSVNADVEPLEGGANPIDIGEGDLPF